MAAIKALFVKLFEPFLTTFVTSLHALSNGSTRVNSVQTWDFSKALEGWDRVFDKVLRGIEDKASQVNYLSYLCFLMYGLTCLTNLFKDRKTKFKPSARIEAPTTPPSDEATGK